MSRAVYITLLLTLCGCAAPYHQHVRIEGHPPADEPHTSQVREPDTAPPHVVIDRTIYHLDSDTPVDVLKGWQVIFRDGHSAAHCPSRTIYVDAGSPIWRDMLAHEIAHAYLCERPPAHHQIMQCMGACYGSPCKD